MISAPDLAREYSTVEALPDEALVLFGADFFSTAGWYRAVVSAGLPAGARAVFVVVPASGRVAAVFPMMVAGQRVQALTTPYTCLWQPLMMPGLDEAAMAAVWRGFARWCRGFGAVRLEAMDGAMAAAVADGVRAAGLMPLPFRHFGNWHGAVADGWPAYWAARPGQVREAVRRRGRKLIAEGGAFSIVSDLEGVAGGITAYEAVYAKSWKAAEPFPDFNPALMRECAQDGSLRLGFLTRGDDVLAVQFWVVRDGWAAVLKLAHDEAAKAVSPGTVLTARMIEWVVERDGVMAVDFGRGDDAYKADWTKARRQRMGLVVANPRRVAGILAAAQYHAGGAMRWCRKAAGGGAER